MYNVAGNGSEQLQFRLITVQDTRDHSSKYNHYPKSANTHFVNRELLTMASNCNYKKSSHRTRSVCLVHPWIFSRSHGFQNWFHPHHYRPHSKIYKDNTQ